MSIIVYINIYTQKDGRSMGEKQLCRKCLLEELDENEYIRSLRDYIKDYPQEKRCPDEEYSRRLAICRECERLDRGMCALCGCFVELRALKKDMYCPDHENKWKIQ